MFYFHSAVEFIIRKGVGKMFWKIFIGIFIYLLLFFSYLISVILSGIILFFGAPSIASTITFLLLFLVFTHQTGVKVMYTWVFHGKVSLIMNVGIFPPVDFVSCMTKNISLSEHKIMHLKEMPESKKHELEARRKVLCRSMIFGIIPALFIIVPVARFYSAL